MTFTATAVSASTLDRATCTSLRKAVPDIKRNFTRTSSRPIALSLRQSTSVFRGTRRSDRQTASTYKPFRVFAAAATETDTMIKVGDKLPGDMKLMVLPEGALDPEEVTLDSILKGKKAVLFGLPGAFTSVCSSKQVPQYKEKYDELKKEGVDVIACMAVNDAYVMRAWADELKVDPNKIHMLGDGDAALHEALGLTQQLPGAGLRARRYSMYVEDGVVRVLNVDEPGPKSYKVSGPEHMLKDLQELKAEGKEQ